MPRVPAASRVPASGNPSAAPLTWRGARTSSRIVVFASAEIVYDDAPAGAGAPAGAMLESAAAAATVTGHGTLGGTLVESAATARAVAGLVAAAGARAETHVGVDQPTGHATASGTLSEGQVAAAAPSGHATLAGSADEGCSRAYAPFGTLTLAGALAETVISAPNASAGGGARFVPARFPPLDPNPPEPMPPVVYFDAPTGRLSLRGDVHESHLPGIADELLLLALV